MATVTTIEWTERTWNPVTGCSKVSQGCKHCYAERIADRFWGDRPFTEVQCHPDRLAHPKSIRRGSMFFVNSMSDLFHPDVPEDFIRAVFTVMAECPQHTFQVLTKRSKRLAELGCDLPWPGNVWMGVSVEDANVIDRIDHLRTVPAAVRFLSLEPLIGPLADLDLAGMHWVIVGGESGPGARLMKPAWVRALRRQCRAARVPFFFKQWGGVFKKHSGRELDRRTYNEFPRKVIPLGAELAEASSMDSRLARRPQGSGISRFTEQQIIAFLKESEAGVPDGAPSVRVARHLRIRGGLPGVTRAGTVSR